ncbi:MAG: uS2m family ribosomal protein [Candidatus Pacearchaeota archaeon]|nr:uS2m family ribosomal protein [Candidatus Pacearchaeota archaeon]
MAENKESTLEEIKEKAEEVIEKVEDTAKKIVKKIEKIVDGKKKTKKIAVKKKTNIVKEEKTNSKKSAFEILKEKAKALEGKVKDAEKIDIKERVTGMPSDEENTLVPIEDYLKSSMHLGTRVITPHMRKYIYKRRADGLAVFNTGLLDKMMREGIDYLAGFAPEDIVVICKRESGWKVAKKFADTFGMKLFTKKYPAGTLTNINLDDFFERELVLICDPWLDKNALSDANRIKTKVMSVCDSNNYTFGIDKFVIGNNKSGKSLGMVFYLFTKLYAEKRNIKIEEPRIEDFIDDWENLVPPK